MIEQLGVGGLGKILRKEVGTQHVKLHRQALGMLFNEWKV